MAKKTLIMIAAIAVAVVLVVTGVVIAIVAANNYLDSLKKYDVASHYSFNGVEVLEDDGLFYLTRDGKKIVKTGYIALESVNVEYFESSTPGTVASYDDFELYDWYLARKPETAGNFLVNSEGTEIAIAGENLEVVEIRLPYVVFVDTVTYEYGILSLKNFDSALSSNAGEELTLTMFSGYKMEDINEGAQKDYVYGMIRSDGTGDDRYIYCDANGAKILESLNVSASFSTIYDEENDVNIRYFVNSLKEMYNMKGELVATDVVGTQNITNSILSADTLPADETLTAEQNAANAYHLIVSPKTSFKLLDKDYFFGTGTVYGNLMYINAKNADGTPSQDFKLINLMTGDSMICQGVVTSIGNDTIRIPSDAAGTNFAYVDTETGKTLIQTKYGDMAWDVTGALVSVSEHAELNATMADPTKAPSKYLHFVSPDKTNAVNLTLAYNETISVLTYNNTAPVYQIVSAENVAANGQVASYNVVKKSLYLPFASTARTANYDKLQYLGVFADGVGVALGIDYDGGKFDFIDAATGSVIKTVAAAGADMAKTNFSHFKTLGLRQDNSVEESTVEFAVIYMTKADDSGKVVETEWFALSRNVVMSDDDALATNAASVVELGKNLFNANFDAVWATDGHLVVNTTARSSALYTVSDSYALEQVTSVPYEIYDVEYYSNNIDDYYIVVVDEQDNYGLFNKEGKMILAPIYEEIDQVVDEEYVIVGEKGGYGVFKINPKKAKAKQIIDCIYDGVYHVGDGGFVVVEYASYYLYDEGKMVKSDRLVGNPDMIYSFSVDEETGKLMAAFNAIFNYDGKLYIHRTEAEEVVVDEYYNYEKLGLGRDNEMIKTESIDDSGVKVVNFRNTDGSLIETKIVYPTEKSAAEFVMTEVWYTSPTKKLQTTAVTDVEIESWNSSGVINLFKAHSIAPGIAG